MSKLIVMLFGFVAFVSCKNSNTTEMVNESKKPKWETLKVNVDNQSIWVQADNDTCYFIQKFKEDTVYAKLHNQYRSERKKFALPKVDRDSLFLLTADAITNPVYSNQTVSDYAGEYVSISLEDRNTSIVCKYSSISSWASISPTLHKINQKTFIKMNSLKDLINF